VAQGRIDVSEGLWPLVVIRYPGETDPSDWEAMFAAIARIHRKKERFYTLHDASRSGVPSAIERAVIGRHTRTLEAESKRLLVGSCIVLESSLIRGALTAIYWIVPSIPKSTLVGTLPEGFAAAAQQMKAEGLTLSPQHEARLREHEAHSK
jgi:hypothetical protein